ncbi:MAG: phosphatase PAP2 family protein [Candidatus Marsarchaeota archaeon]|nr:phosphatase PAP2 family protein [Candidatus Marsarchaeota archaeon]
MDFISTYIASLNYPWFTWVSSLIANDYLYGFFIIILFFLSFKYMKKWRELAVTILISLILFTSLKYIVKEPRPCVQLNAKLSCPSSYSFPSGHSSIINAFLFPSLYDSSAFIFTPLSLIVMFSRVYIGVHTFYDVLGGFVVALISFLLSSFLVKRFWPKKLEQKIVLALPEFMRPLH